MASNKNSTYDQEIKKLLLGVDYGKNNIGLAFGRNNLVTPLTVVSGRNDLSAITEIGKYVYENKVDKIIIGLPLTEGGKDTNQSRTVRRFAKLLKMKLKKPVELINEFRTTSDSKTEAINLGISKKRRQIVDDLSAALVLKEYYARLQ